MRAKNALTSTSPRTLKLVIGFQGTAYEGWQSQKKGNTLQEIFERILAKILKEKVNLVGSSRTDSGVHALGFVAHFKTISALPNEKIKAALNFYLPRDIVVFSVETATNNFHARHLAKSKLYQYDIWLSPTRPLFQAPFVLWYPHPLKVSLMKKAAPYFVGRHDFGAFKDAGDELASFVRTIKKISIMQKKELLRIQIEGDGFLRHMVRIIVGTLIEVGKERLKPTEIKKIIKSCDRRRAGPTIKACGLTLIRVNY